ncbi:hypothetical protein AK812_SmicGene4895 [Symbiodinium microadriaticum]|uniref:Uncharacterized protein n=1 Tax=Symbiodinium microadriaticum TaxID=2951 RepID=A0A1Q9EV22_SYMMI|nr:hypothetical protein AK812_SmicGene4895 [Symbiodinium microadriaticum]
MGKVGQSGDTRANPPSTPIKKRSRPMFNSPAMARAVFPGAADDDSEPVPDTLPFLTPETEAWASPVGLEMLPPTSPETDPNLAPPPLKRGFRRQFSEVQDLEKVCLEEELATAERETKRLKAENQRLQSCVDSLQGHKASLQGQLNHLRGMLHSAMTNGTGASSSSGRFGLVTPDGMRALFGESTFRMEDRIFQTIQVTESLEFGDGQDGGTPNPVPEATTIVERSPPSGTPKKEVRSTLGSPHNQDYCLSTSVDPTSGPAAQPLNVGRLQLRRLGPQRRESSPIGGAQKIRGAFLQLRRALQMTAHVCTGFGAIDNSASGRHGRRKEAAHTMKKRTESQPALESKRLPSLTTRSTSQPPDASLRKAARGDEVFSIMVMRQLQLRKDLEGQAKQLAASLPRLNSKTADSSSQQEQAAAMIASMADAMMKRGHARQTNQREERRGDGEHWPSLVQQAALAASYAAQAEAGGSSPLDRRGLSKSSLGPDEAHLSPFETLVVERRRARAVKEAAEARKRLPDQGVSAAKHEEPRPETPSYPSPFKEQSAS